MTTENQYGETQYKSRDHLFRTRDEYANAKYDITTRWLKRAIEPGKTLLNIGCGSGEYNLRIAEQGLRVVACEPEENAFQAAKKLMGGRPDISLYQSSFSEFATQVEPGDLLVMHDVLEHIEDDQTAVKHVAKLVKAQGEAVISVPAFQWLFGFHDEQLGHYRRYTKRHLVSLFREQFDIIHARYFGSLFIPVTLWFSRIKRKSYPLEAASQAGNQKILRWACQFQRMMPEPIGTSVLVHLRKKS